MRKQAFKPISFFNSRRNMFLTAIVFMPVKSVTVADPPRINIELTMIFVANLKANLNRNARELFPRNHSPEKHEYQMSCLAPPNTDNF